MAIAKSGVLFLGLTALAAAQQNLKHVEFFEARVRPVLANKCYSCHADNRLGGLRVDSRSALLEGGKRGGAIVPGKPDASLLIQAVLQTDEKLKMPMAGGKLKENEIADLKYWIQIGAPWPDAVTNVQQPSASESKKGFGIRPEQRSFWSFQPLKKPATPEVKDKA
ncbi:MAG: c-type cytochrome domain-containing protein, partial [Bryobacteraceae bacterium]